MEDLRRKNHTLVDLINKVACQLLKAIPNRTNVFWSEGPDLSLEEVFTKFCPVPDVGSLETHDGYFCSLPSGSEHSGDTLDQVAKIRNAQFPLIFNLQPLMPIEPKDDRDIPHITSANRPHDRLASVFRMPKLSEPLISTHTPHWAKTELTGFAALDCAQSSLRRSKPTMYISPLACHNSPEYVPSGSDTLKPPIISITDVLESEDESFQSLGGTLSSIIGKKLASGQASAQPSAGSASGSNASLGGESAMEYEPHSVSQPDIDDTDNAQSLGRSSADTQSLPPQNVIHPYMPHNKLLPTSDDEMSLGGESTKDPSSDNEMADDESMEENTLGVNLSCHSRHTPPAV
ncbi:hypothetical protein BDN71DRAFT_1573841 [Pleurotus eryngii]|uniref:Uncharacterized protein n=1 Tax=Pleurotus eryngii TaxID=5323 RepID=A0A9P5ZUI7_PLEER|nr:hypothetical protein BDN71DRAFT_1573841 [Pleurotus eryngii]